MSQLLNMLSRLVITFLPRSKHLLVSWLQSPSSVILEPPKIKSDTVCTVSPSIKSQDQPKFMGCGDRHRDPCLQEQEDSSLSSLLAVQAQLPFLCLSSFINFCLQLRAEAEPMG